MSVELDGTWHQVGGVMRWSPALPPLPVRRKSIHDLIACGACGARVDERCHSRAGNVVGDHEARLVSVRCPCGERVKSGYWYCSDPCRATARKRTYRLREIRRPTSERRIQMAS